MSKAGARSNCRREPNECSILLNDEGMSSLKLWARVEGMLNHVQSDKDRVFLTAGMSKNEQYEVDSSSAIGMKVPFPWETSEKPMLFIVVSKNQRSI
jgi:hypothetical protein